MIVILFHFIRFDTRPQLPPAVSDSHSLCLCRPASDLVLYLTALTCTFFIFYFIFFSQGVGCTTVTRAADVVLCPAALPRRPPLPRRGRVEAVLRRQGATGPPWGRAAPGHAPGRCKKGRGGSAAQRDRGEEGAPAGRGGAAGVSRGLSRPGNVFLPFVGNLLNGKVHREQKFC